MARTSKQAHSRSGCIGRTYHAELRRRRIEATERRGLAAARSLSEVKVRCVGTGCARIHFFGLTVCTFFSKPSRHQFPCSTDLASIGHRARDIFPPHKHTHTNTACWIDVLATLSFSPSLSLSTDTDPLSRFLFLFFGF